MNIKIVDLKPEHIENFQPQEDQKVDFTYMKKHIHELSTEDCYAAIDEDINKVIAIGGLVKIAYGIGEVWIAFDCDVDKYGPYLLRHVKKGIKKYYPGDYWRIQATVDVRFNKALKFIERLGFRYEGIIHKYVCERDYYRFALWED